MDVQKLTLLLASTGLPLSGVSLALAPEPLDHVLPNPTTTATAAATTAHVVLEREAVETETPLPVNTATCTTYYVTYAFPPGGETSTCYTSTVTSQNELDCQGCMLSVVYAGHVFENVDSSTTVTATTPLTITQATCAPSLAANPTVGQPHGQSICDGFWCVGDRSLQHLATRVSPEAIHMRSGPVSTTAGIPVKCTQGACGEVNLPK